MQTKTLFHIDGGLNTTYCHRRPRYYKGTMISSNPRYSARFVKDIKTKNYDITGIDYMIACDDCLEHYKNNTCGKKKCVQHLRDSK